MKTKIGLYLWQRESTERLKAMDGPPQGPTLNPFRMFEPSRTIKCTDESTVHSEESIGLELQKRVDVAAIRR